MKQMKISGNFINFLSNLTIDIRKSELICGLLPFCFLSEIFLPTQFSHYVDWVIKGYIGFLIGFLSIKGILFVRMFSSRKQCEHISIWEIKDLANKLDLDLPAQPFCVVDNKYVMARIIPNKKQILFGKNFLNSLTGGEKMFVGGHEFFHIFGPQDRYLMLTFIPTIMLVFIFPYLLHLSISIIIAGIGPLLVSVSLTSRSIESMADLYGAKHAGKDNAISALTKGYGEKRHTLFDFHPSLKTRIRNLEKNYPTIM